MISNEIIFEDLFKTGKKKQEPTFENLKAAFTHYLHTFDPKSGQKLKKSAVTFVNNYYNSGRKIHGNDTVFEEMVHSLSDKMTDLIPFLPNKYFKFDFIDLFAGVGGFRMAMQNLGGRCVFSSELDSSAKTTYLTNFGEYPFGDITADEVKSFIPKKFDILCAGFPCQSFSIAGKRGGFEDTRGTLFFEVADILKRHKPKAFFLENVKGLTSHDKGKTIETILNVLRNDLNYFVPDPQIINAKKFGVPQNRERIFIVGFRKDLKISSFDYPEGNSENVKLNEIIEKKKVSVKYYLSQQYLDTLRSHKARHAKKGNGFGYQIIPVKGIANAIVVGGMGRERNLIIDKRLTNFEPVTKIKGKVNNEWIRRLTPRECAGLQGFPKSFIIPVADSQAYKQFGNSVAIPAIQATAKQVLKQLGY